MPCVLPTCRVPCAVHDGVSRPAIRQRWITGQFSLDDGLAGKPHCLRDAITFWEGIANDRHANCGSLTITLAAQSDKSTVAAEKEVTMDKIEFITCPGGGREGNPHELTVIEQINQLQALWSKRRKQ